MKKKKALNFGYKKGSEPLSLGKALSARNSNKDIENISTPLDSENEIQDKIDEILSLAIENNIRFQKIGDYQQRKSNL